MQATRYALHELEMVMPDGVVISVWFDGNSKVTLNNGTFEEPAANAFSLVQVTDCPGATPACINICYVHKLEANEQAVHDKYRINSAAIRLILSNLAYIEIATDAFAGYINNYCKDGFRWHISGDIFSFLYALFIQRICLMTPRVRHWIYTRSFNYIYPLYRVPNLVLNLSADKDNIDEALCLGKIYRLRVCYLSIDGEVPGLPKGSVIFPNHKLRGRDLPKPTDALWWQSLTLEQRQTVCPPDFFGQSDRIRCGPCKKCLK